jgi:hypothetical protein
MEELEQKADALDGLGLGELDFTQMTPYNLTPKAAAGTGDSHDLHHHVVNKNTFFGDEYYVQIQKHLNSVRVELSGVEKSARAASERSQEQERQLRTLRECMERQKTELESSWQQKLDQKEMEKETLHRRLTDETNARLAENNARLNESNADLAEASKLLADAKSQLVITRAELERKSKEMDGRLCQSEQGRQGLLEELSKLAAERQADKCKADELSQTVIQLTASVVELETKLSVLRQERARVEESHAAAIRSLEAQFEIDRLNLNAEHATQLADLKANYEKQRSEINAPLQVEINELKRANAELQHQARVAAKRVRFAEEFWIDAKKESENMLKKQFEDKIREFKAKLVEQEVEVDVAAAMTNLSNVAAPAIAPAIVPAIKLSKNNHAHTASLSNLPTNEDDFCHNDALSTASSSASQAMSTSSRVSVSQVSAIELPKPLKKITSKDLQKMRKLTAPFPLAGLKDETAKESSDEFDSDVCDKAEKVVEEAESDDFERQYMSVKDGKISWSSLFARSYADLYNSTYDCPPRAEWVDEFLHAEPTILSMKRAKGLYQRRSKPKNK